MLTRNRIILLTALCVSSFFLYVVYKKPTPDFVQPEPLQVTLPAEVSLPVEDVVLPKPNCEDYDQSLAELVDYQPTPKEPFFQAPCPISRDLQKDITSRMQIIGFGAEQENRPWLSIAKRMEDKIPLEEFKKNIRNFIIIILKLQMPNNFHLFGASEAGDLMAFARHAICDEVAVAHHHIKGGIFPMIGQDYVEHAFEISKEDRVLFETLYRSCRMTAANAYRYAPGRFTRVAFYPEAADWNAILTALKIDSKRPNEVVCTYKGK